MESKRGEVKEGEEDKPDKPEHILQFAFSKKTDKALRTQEDGIEQTESATTRNREEEERKSDEEEDLVLGNNDIDMSSSDGEDMDISTSEDDET